MQKPVCITKQILSSPEMVSSVKPTLCHELPFWQAGLRCLAGLDEAGRGAWAGAVYAAAVILPDRESILEELDGVRDSKLMTPMQRDNWTGIIQEKVLTWGVGSASHLEIDRMGILPATQLAMQRALESLKKTPDHLLLDAVLLRNIDLSQTALIKGDRICLSIACASILAKVSRDREMIRLDQEYPGYGFAGHKGYGTSRHRQALRENGACPIHRKSYAPVRLCQEKLFIE